MRRLTWAILLLQCLLLNVLLPGHTRGAVTLNGQAGASAREKGSCCVVGQDGKRKHVPTSEERRCCAVCYVMGMLSPGVPVVIAIQPLGMLCTIQPTAPPAVLVADQETPRDSRGPPIF